MEGDAASPEGGGAAIAVLLALDPGTRATGWAVFVGERPVRWGLLVATGRVHDRIASILEQLDRLMAGVKINEVACEKPQGYGWRPAPQLETLVTELGHWASKRGAVWRPLNPSQVRSACQVGGRWNKDVAALAVRALYDITGVDHNVTDALCIGYSAHRLKALERL